VVEVLVVEVLEEVVQAVVVLEVEVLEVEVLVVEVLEEVVQAVEVLEVEVLEVEVQEVEVQEVVVQEVVVQEVVVQEVVVLEVVVQEVGVLEVEVLEEVVQAVEVLVEAVLAEALEVLVVVVLVVEVLVEKVLAEALVEVVLVVEVLVKVLVVLVEVALVVVVLAAAFPMAVVLVEVALVAAFPMAAVLVVVLEMGVRGSSIQVGIVLVVTSEEHGGEDKEDLHHLEGVQDGMVEEMGDMEGGILEDSSVVLLHLFHNPCTWEELGVWVTAHAYPLIVLFVDFRSVNCYALKLLRKMAKYIQGCLCRRQSALDCISFQGSGCTRPFVENCDDRAFGAIPPPLAIPPPPAVYTYTQTYREYPTSALSGYYQDTMTIITTTTNPPWWKPYGANNPYQYPGYPNLPTAYPAPPPPPPPVNVPIQVTVPVVLPTTAPVTFDGGNVLYSPGYVTAIVTTVTILDPNAGMITQWGTLTTIAQPTIPIATPFTSAGVQPYPVNPYPGSQPYSGNPYPVQTVFPGGADPYSYPGQQISGYQPQNQGTRTLPWQLGGGYSTQTQPYLTTPYPSNSYPVSGYPGQPYTISGYSNEPFSFSGYSSQPYSFSGYSTGSYPISGYPYEPYPVSGYSSQPYPISGYPSGSYPISGYPAGSSGYSNEPLPSWGHSNQPYTASGYSSESYSASGYPGAQESGYPPGGFSVQPTTASTIFMTTTISNQPYPVVETSAITNPVQGPNLATQAQSQPSPYSVSPPYSVTQPYSSVQTAPESMITPFTVEKHTLTIPPETIAVPGGETITISGSTVTVTGPWPPPGAAGYTPTPAQWTGIAGLISSSRTLDTGANSPVMTTPIPISQSPSDSIALTPGFKAVGWTPINPEMPYTPVPEPPASSTAFFEPPQQNLPGIPIFEAPSRCGPNSPRCDDQQYCDPQPLCDGGSSCPGVCLPLYGGKYSQPDSIRNQIWDKVMSEGIYRVKVFTRITITARNGPVLRKMVKRSKNYS
jgi:hypothetical protein